MRKPRQKNHGGIACRESRCIRNMHNELVRPAGFLMMFRMTLKLEKDHVCQETAVIPGMIWVGWFKGSVFPLGSSQSVMLDVIHGFQKKDCHKGLSDKEDQPAQSVKPQHHHSDQETDAVPNHEFIAEVPKTESSFFQSFEFNSGCAHNVPNYCLGKKAIQRDPLLGARCIFWGGNILMMTADMLDFETAVPHA